MRRSRSRTAVTNCRWSRAGKTFVRPRTATAASVMTNFKTVRGHRFVQLIFCLLSNMGTEFALHDPIEKRAHLIFIAAHLHLHAPVDQVTHPAGDLETFSDVPD